MPADHRIPAPAVAAPAGTAPPALREDLDAHPGECLVCYLDRLLRHAGCTGSFALTAWWRDLRAPRATTLLARLSRLGAECDCEVPGRVYESGAGGVLDAWDRQRCAGVQRGSAQPCARWRLRPRWSQLAG